MEYQGQVSEMYKMSSNALFEMSLDEVKIHFWILMKFPLKLLSILF